MQFWDFWQQIYNVGLFQISIKMQFLDFWQQIYNVGLVFCSFAHACKVLTDENDDNQYRMRQNMDIIIKW